MKQIPLTQGQFAIVDDQDYDYLMQWKWCAAYCKRGKRFYALRTYKVDGKQLSIGMHRQLIGVVDKSIKVDHIDHDGLNNTRKNLRTTSHSQNMANRRPKQNGTSEFLGVYKIKDKNTWIAQITKNNKRIKLGSYKNEVDAAKAYDNAAIEMHGEFANVNFKLGVFIG